MLARQPDRAGGSDSERSIDIGVLGPRLVRVGRPPRPGLRRRTVQQPSDRAPQQHGQHDRHVVDGVVPTEMDRADEDEAEEGAAGDARSLAHVPGQPRDDPGRGDVHAGRRGDAAHHAEIVGRIAPPQHVLQHRGREGQADGLGDAGGDAAQMATCSANRLGPS